MPVRSLRSSVLKWPGRAVVDQAVRQWASVVAQTRDDVLAVAYLGSYARGDWEVGSDLDLLILGRLRPALPSASNEVRHPSLACARRRVRLHRGGVAHDGTRGAQVPADGRAGRRLGVPVRLGTRRSRAGAPHPVAHRLRIRAKRGRGVSKRRFDLPQVDPHVLVHQDVSEPA